MKTLTVRLPDTLMAQIETESRRRRVSKSAIVRERLARTPPSDSKRPATLDAIFDLIGSVDGLPSNMSARTKRYLKATC